jgi:hypothetical protein
LEQAAKQESKGEALRAIVGYIPPKHLGGLKSEFDVVRVAWQIRQRKSPLAGRVEVELALRPRAVQLCVEALSRDAIVVEKVPCRIVCACWMRGENARQKTLRCHERKAARLLPSIRVDRAPNRVLESRS